MRALGFEPKREEVRKMIADVDQDGRCEANQKTTGGQRAALARTRREKTRKKNTSPVKQTTNPHKKKQRPHRL